MTSGEHAMLSKAIELLKEHAKDSKNLEEYYAQLGDNFNVYTYGFEAEAYEYAIELLEDVL